MNDYSMQLRCHIGKKTWIIYLLPKIVKSEVISAARYSRAAVTLAHVYSRAARSPS